MANERIFVASKLPTPLICCVGRANEVGVYEPKALFTLPGVAVKKDKGQAPADGVSLILVDKADWEAFEATGHPAVKAGMIFANGSKASAQAEAREKVPERTGFEGMDPAKPGPGLMPAKQMEKLGIPVPVGA